MDLGEEIEDRSELENDFEKATEFMKTVAGHLDKNRLLYFYARFKQATVGQCNKPRPGMFDFQGKQKWDAWHGLKDMGSTQAMEEYVAAMDEVEPDWMDGVKGRKSSQGLGVGVSTMANDAEPELSDSQKTIFDWCKEGRVDQVRLLLSSEGSRVNQRDDEGLTCLHWACDRGHLEVVSVLLERKADVNAMDEDGQTPLHYACTCEHMSIIEVLVRNGADVNAVDADGNTAAKNTYKKDIHELLAKYSNGR